MATALIGLVTLTIPSATIRGALNGHSSLLVPLIVLWAVWARPSEDERLIPAWRAVQYGVISYALYDLAWYGEWLGWLTLPRGLGDLFNLAFAPMCLVGLLRATTPAPTKHARAVGYLDAVILTLATSTIVSSALALTGGVLRPLLTARDLVLVLSPMVDVLTLSGLALVWTRRAHTAPVPWIAPLVGAVLTSLVADVWFAFMPSVGAGSPWFVIAGWFAAWTLIGRAATAPARADAAPVGHVTRLPYVLALGSYASLLVIIAADARHAILPTALAIGVLTIFVLARQVVALRDLSLLQQGQSRAEADARLAALVQHSSDTTLILDERFCVTWISPAVTATFGATEEMLQGRSIMPLVHRDDQATALRALEQLLAHPEERATCVVRLLDAAGAARWVEATGSNLLGVPSVGGLVLNARDITERRLLEQQMLDLALRDPLTGLGNRRLFRDRLTHALERRHRRPDGVAVLLIDLDHFKVINDTMGHAQGDALLVSVGERLSATLRTSDTIARLGGDEFGVLLEDLTDAREADATAARVQHAFGIPLLLDGRVFDVRASIGLASARDGQDADEVLADADVAMYSAKAMGRGRSARFTEAMRAEVVERHEIETDLRRALERDEFEVVYQPQVDLRTGEVIGAEALVRWRHPEKGVVPPARFIGIAEQSDLIVTIGRRVLGAAARDVRRFMQIQGGTRFHVAVNFSPRELGTGALADVLASVTQDAGIPTDLVMVELTESAFATDEGAIAAELQRLRALGVRIALDDFGTGYSALAYLRKFPIDIIKVDKSFVSWVRRDAANDGVTRAIVSMARSLSLDTIAEGVETDDQVAWLQGMGCTMGQGYLFGRPVAASDFEGLLRGWNPARYASRQQAPLP